MKICIERYLEKTTDGKTLFCNRLGTELLQRGVSVTGNINDPVDISIDMIRIKHPTSKIKILRLDGVYFDNQIDYKRKNKILLDSMKKADGVIYQSQFSKDMCDKYLMHFNRPKQIIFNGAPPAFYSTAKDTRKNYKYVFFAMANWRKFKRLEDSIESFLLADIDDSVLYIGGDISRSGVNKKTYANNPKVKFLGHMIQDQIASYLKIADGVLHLSWFDACPNSVVEAVTSGVPVICGNVGGTQEIVKRSGGYVCNIEKPYKLESVNVYNPPKINRNKVASAILKCILDRPVINNDHVNIKNTADKYLEFLESFTNEKIIIKENDLISIVVTLYNYANYIEDLIKSVRSQTYTNWELIIVDDCSTDNPDPMINKYMKKDKRIKHIKFSKNRGYSIAKNKGIISAKGDYIVMIDADDMLTANSLEYRYNALINNPEKLWCHGDVYVLTRRGELSHRSKIAKQQLEQDLIRSGMNLKKQYAIRMVHAQSVMVRRKLHEIVGLYDEELPCSSDTEMWDRIIQLGHIPVHVKKFVSIYRIHGKQMHDSDFKRNRRHEIKSRRIANTKERIKNGINKSNTRLLEIRKCK